MRVIDRRQRDLQAVHRAVLQRARPNAAQLDHAPADRAAANAARVDHVALNAVVDRAQRHRFIAARQAVVGVLRHPHGHAHADALCDHFYRVAQVDSLQIPVLPVFLRFRAVDKAHVQCHVRQVFARVIRVLRGLPHQGVALILRALIVALRLLLRVLHVHKRPFDRGIGVYVRAVYVFLRQVERLPVLVLAPGHDARRYVGIVHAVGNTQEVLALAYLDAGFLARALGQIDIPPVARQLAAVIFDQPAVAHDRLSRVFVRDLHALGGRVQIAVEGKVLWGERRRNQAGQRRRAGCVRVRRVAAHHIVHQVVKDVSRIDGDIGHRRHDPVNAEWLIAQDRRLPDRFLRRRAGRFCADVCQIPRPHIAVLPVRRGHFVPLRVRLGNQNHFRIGLVGVYALCALAWLRAKV